MQLATYLLQAVFDVFYCQGNFDSNVVVSGDFENINIKINLKIPQKGSFMVITPSRKDLITWHLLLIYFSVDILQKLTFFKLKPQRSAKIHSESRKN